MTDERKAEVNRRLFEFGGTAERYAVKAGEVVDYTADLNALARLDAKLPPHKWSILWAYSMDYPLVRLSILKGKVMRYDTEAEARAEAICQYLESR